MRNSLLIFLNLALLILLTQGCKHKSVDNSNDAKQITPTNVTQLNLVGHWLGEGKRERLFREAVNEFEFINQDIRVNMKFPEELYKGNEGERDFIISQITKPVADFDILRLKSHYPIISRMLNNENWGSKYLLDFSSIPGFREAHLPTIDMEAIKRRTGNICVSACLEGNYEVIFANLTIAKKVGITIKQYGMTFEDFLSYIKAVDTYNKTNHTSIIAIFENADNDWITSETIFKRLFFSLLDGFTEINDIRYSDKKIRALEQTYKAYEELSKYNPIRNNKSRMNIDWGNDNDYPLKDSCLFFVNGSYMYNIWDGKDPKALSKIMPCELPVFNPSDTYLGDYSSTWCVPQNAPNREAAIKFIMFWCRPEMAEKWVRYTKCPSGIVGNLTENTFGSDAFEDFQYTIDKKYSNRLIPSTDYKVITGEKNNYSLNSTLVLGGTISAAEAIKNMRRSLIRN